MKILGRALVLLTLVALLPLVAGWRPAAQPQEATQLPARPPERTLMLLRHAETAESTETTRDPELSDAGERRAAALARLLSHAGVTHLFASEYKRTQATLAPLAEALDLEIEVVPADRAGSQLEALRALPEGAVAVVCGHSNTIPGLAAAVGCEPEGLVDHEVYGPMLGKSEYDRLFVVHLLGASFGRQFGKIPHLELRYGE